MKIEGVVPENWSVFIYNSASSGVPLMPLQRLADELVRLSTQSAYAPGSGSLHEVIEQIFSGANNFPEIKSLGVLVDPQKKIRGFYQVRYFEETADLDFILVDESLRRQGFGRRLMAVMENTLRAVSVHRILLEVGAQNLAAAELYQQLGFKKISRRKGYYRSGEDALVMEKSI